jgi:uncharacterized protein
MVTRPKNKLTLFPPIAPQAGYKFMGIAPVVPPSGHNFRFYIFSIVLFILAIIIPCSISLAQNKKSDIILDNQKFRDDMNKEFADTAQTPLTKEGLAGFKVVDFFPINPRFRFKAKLTRTPKESPFEMPRSKGNTGTYRKYGEASFTYKGKEYKVNVYQYMKLINDKKYAKYLFLPFTDLTNGKQTYGGGRFLDLEIPDNNEIIIDFNKAYNPLCAYGNQKYSCPIPPKENFLEIKIKAGVKMYEEN